MQHSVVQVAKNERLDEIKFKEFAKTNHLKYSIIINENDYLTVSTFRCDELVKDFKSKQ